MGDLADRLAIAKEIAAEAEAAANLAWLDGVGLGSKGMKKASKAESFDRALAHYKEGMDPLKAFISNGEADSECTELLSSLRAGCSQVLIDKGLPYTAMREAAQAVDLDPENLNAHLLRARAVLNMERAQEMYYGDETEHDEYLFQARASLEKVLSKEKTNTQAKDELEYCLYVIEMGPPTEDPDGTPSDPGFGRSGSRSGSLSRRPWSGSGMRSGSLSGVRGEEGSRPMSASMRRSPSLGSLQTPGERRAPSPGRISGIPADPGKIALSSSYPLTSSDNRRPASPGSAGLRNSMGMCCPPNISYEKPGMQGAEMSGRRSGPGSGRPSTPTRVCPPCVGPTLGRSRSDVGVGSGLGSLDARRMVNESFSRRSSRADMGAPTAGSQMKSSSRGEPAPVGTSAASGRASRGELSASRGSGRR